MWINSTMAISAYIYIYIYTVCFLHGVIFNKRLEFYLFTLAQYFICYINDIWSSLILFVFHWNGGMFCISTSYIFYFKFYYNVVLKESSYSEITILWSDIICYLWVIMYIYILAIYKYFWKIFFILIPYSEKVNYFIIYFSL